MEENRVICADCEFCDPEAGRCMITDRDVRPTYSCQKGKKVEDDADSV